MTDNTQNPIPKPGLNFSFKKKKEAGSPTSPELKKNVPKRWIYVGLTLVGTVMLISTLSSSDKNKPNQNNAQPKKQEKLVDITPPKMGQKAWEAQTQQEIKELKELLIQRDEAQRKQEAEMKRLNEEMTNLKNKKETTALPPDVVAPPTAGGTPKVNIPASALPPPLPPTTESNNKLNTLSTSKPAQGQGLPATLPTPEKTEAPLSFPAPAISATDGETEKAASEDVKVNTSYQKNQFAGFLPSGAFAPVALLHGLDAATSVSAQSNPQPVLIRIQDYATLPGAAKYKLKSCFVLGSAYGEMSSERVYVRLAQLSCVDTQDSLVLSNEVAGYVVDSDGKLGLRGVVSDRQGAKLSKALLAGFAQGLGSALSGAQGQVTSSALGSVNSISGSDALRASGLSGASTAANQLAQFYLKEAQTLFPVITIDAGRTGNIVFSKGVSLQWNDQSTQYRKDVNPVNKRSF